jgi:hypothetical protein
MFALLDDSQKVADFDLPEQSLVVIEFDDENRSGTAVYICVISHFLQLQIRSLPAVHNIMQFRLQTKFAYRPPFWLVCSDVVLFCAALFRCSSSLLCGSIAKLSRKICSNSEATKGTCRFVICVLK